MTANNNTKKLGFMSVFFLGINGIVGSAIFLMPGKVYAKVGNVSIGLVFISAIMVLSLALCYADLASRFTQNGAAWLYSYNAFGRFMGFEVGFFTWLLGVITLGTETCAFVETIGTMVPIFNNDLVYSISCIIIIVILAIVNLAGVKSFKIVDNFSSIVKLLVLIGFIIIGLFFMHMINFKAGHSIHVTFNSFNSAFGAGFYMFTGFSLLPIAAAKMNNPSKNVPKALITVILASAIVYAGVQAVSIGILGKSISGSVAPLAYAFKSLFGIIGDLFIVIGMAISILGVAISVSFSTPITASSLAIEHQLLPKFFGNLLKNGAPWVSIIITSIIGIVLALSHNYLFLASCVVFVSVMQYIPTIFATMKFQNKDKKSKKSIKNNNTSNNNNVWRLPGGKTIPIIALIMTLYMLTSFTVETWIVGISEIIISLIIYFVDKKNHNKKDINNINKNNLSPTSK